MISPAAKVVATAEHIATEMSDETVILHLTSGVYYGLDAVGSFIWSQLQTPTDVESICTALLREYDVDAERARRDVERLLEQLHAHALITTAS